MKHNPAFDGLRAIAIIAVMLFHSRAPYVSGGFLGVDVFFVLSGFLITHSLLIEADSTGTVDVIRFYKRRLARLMPAMTLMLMAYVIFAPLYWPNSGDHYLQAVLSILYLADYSIAIFGVPSQLSHMWSLSIEEHFYILWPPILLLICRRYTSGQAVIVLFVAWLFFTAWRWAWIQNGQSWEQIYYRFDTRLSGLIFGALLAKMVSGKVLVSLTKRHYVHLLWCVLFLAFIMRYGWHDLFMLRYGISIAEIASGAIILAVVRRNAAFCRALSIFPLVYIGRLSYGIYLWHYPIFRYLREEMAWGDVMLIGGGMSVLLSAFSYYSIERFYRSRWRK